MVTTSTVHAIATSILAADFDLVILSSKSQLFIIPNCIRFILSFYIVRLVDIPRKN